MQPAAGREVGLPSLAGGWQLWGLSQARGHAGACQLAADAGAVRAHLGPRRRRRVDQHCPQHRDDHVCLTGGALLKLAACREGEEDGKSAHRVDQFLTWATLAGCCCPGWLAGEQALKRTPGHRAGSQCQGAEERE